MVLITDEHLIISTLLSDKNYFNKVFPYIKPEYFYDDIDKKIFNIVKNYAAKYSKVPDYTIIKNIIASTKSLSETDSDLFGSRINTIKEIETPNNIDFAIDKAEKFCQDRALYNAIVKSYEIYDGANKTDKIGTIPDIVKSAIMISFNDSIGHDYDNDAEERWDYYNNPETKVAFEFETMNAITNGGVNLKTLNLIAGGVNIGKTLMLIILAAMYKKLGYDVLYISNEVSEMEVGKRVDASLLGIDTDMIVELAKSKYLEKIAALKESGGGRLIIKEYPTGTCDSLTVEAELQELALKKDFKPTIIINDYITINASSSISKNANMYQYYNSIAEEMRALAVKHNCVMWTAAQLKTEAMDATDVSISQLADSQGIARTADLIWCVIRHEELDRRREVTFIQLKTRYHNVKYIRWNMGIDVSKHRLVDTNPVIEGVTDKYKPIKYNKPNTDNNKLKVVNVKSKGKNKINFNTDNSEVNTDEYKQYVSV